MTGVPIRVAVGAATHPGRRRIMNEDAHLAAAPLFLVADGMGGHDAGDLASKAVVAEFAALAGAPSLDVEEVRAALVRAQERVKQLDTRDRAAGTTLSGVVVAQAGGVGYWLTVNVGDSRTYRFAGGVLEQISIDHSVVQELIDAGLLDPADAMTDRRRHEITRAIGAGTDGEADYWMLPAEPGDRILVCSDGLSGEVGAERLAQLLAEVTDPHEAAARLVEEALARGGRDNITAVVVDAIEVAGYVDLFDTAPAGGRAADADTIPRPANGRSS